MICELVNDDGTVTKGQQVLDFADRHKLVHVTIADMIAYRQAREKLVERVGQFSWETPVGPATGYAYRTPFDPFTHLALVYGSIGDGRNVLTRFHKANLLEDIFAGSKSANAALKRFQAEGQGVLVYLRDGAAGVPVTPAPGADNSDDMRNKIWREVGVGAQILRDLGVHSIRNLSATPRSFVGVSGFGIEIAGSVPLEG